MLKRHLTEAVSGSLSVPTLEPAYFRLYYTKIEGHSQNWVKTKATQQPRQCPLVCNLENSVIILKLCVLKDLAIRDQGTS